MEKKVKWKDHVKTTPYISPLQAFSSNGIYQETKHKTFHCPVCLGRYLEQEERPKKLPCNHLICLLCYKNIKAEGINHCPICQVQHKFIRTSLTFKSDSDITNNNVSSLESSQNLSLSGSSLELQRDQSDMSSESDHCLEHRFKILDAYCNTHDIRICSECEHKKHNSNNCKVITCEQEMKGRQLKTVHSIDSKIHLMTKLHSRITEFLDILKKEDSRNSEDVDEQINAVHGLLEEVKVKKIFLSDAKREVEKQEIWENVLSACGDADLKILYIDNSLKDMYTKLEAIRLHYTVRQQIGYGEEKKSCKNKLKPTENIRNSELFHNIPKNEHQLIKESKKGIIANADVQPDQTDHSMSKIKNKKKYIITQDKDALNKEMKHENSQQPISIIDNNVERVVSHDDPKHKKQENKIIKNTEADGPINKRKHEKQHNIPKDMDDLNKEMKHDYYQQPITINDRNFEQVISHDIPKHKIINPWITEEYELYDISQKADGLQSIKNIANEAIKESFENELIPEKKYTPLDKDIFQEAVNTKYIYNNIDLGIFDENIELFMCKNESNDITYGTDKSFINGGKSIESKILLKKLLSDTKRQKDLKISEVNKLTICLFLMFILSSIFYFMFARENNIIKDDLSKALRQKGELETHIANSLLENNMMNDDLSKALSQKEELEIHIGNSLLEINALQQKLDETQAQRDFFHLKLNEALILQGRETAIQEVTQIQNKETSWYSWLGSLFYYGFYLTFRILILTASFIILTVGGEKLNEDYLTLNISDNINRSISMVVVFLILYELFGIVTWMTNLPLTTSPLFNWYQPENLFIVDGVRKFSSLYFMYRGLLKWLSTAIVGIMVLGFSVYIMSEISEKMKSHGVDKQNHDAFFIISWPLLCVALSIFLVWLSTLPIT